MALVSALRSKDVQPEAMNAGKPESEAVLPREEAHIQLKARSKLRSGLALCGLKLSSSNNEPGQRELKQFSEIQKQAERAISLINPKLRTLLSNPQVKVLLCNDVSQVIGQKGRFKAGSTTLPLVSKNTGQKHYLILIDVETFRTSKAAITAALSFELHRAAAALDPEAYPEGLISVLKANISDLKKVELSWQKVGNAADAQALAEQIGRRHAAIEILKGNIEK